MKVEHLTPKHYQFLKDKYTHLYELKMEWAVPELISSLVSDHIRRVAEEMDYSQYMREIGKEDIATAPIDIKN